MSAPALPRSTGGEPVGRAARVVQVLTTAAPLLILVAGLTGIATTEEATSVLDATVTAVGAVGTVVGLVAPIVTARRVRAEVTPNEAVVAYRTRDVDRGGVTTVGTVVAGEGSSSPTGEPVLVRAASDVGDVDPLQE